MSPTEPPLKGVTVVDISSSYAAPTASMYLADMGADVIKVEPVAGDDARGWGPPFVNGEAAWFLSANRNKRSLCLDIRGEAGREVLFRLLASADVFIENLNPAKLARHGLELQALRARFPHLVICGLSGFGMTGPDSALPGYDLIAQARSGMMSVTGENGSPTRVSTALSDVAAGTVAAFAIASALVRQQRTGEGEIIDISLLEADLAFMSPRIATYLIDGEEPVPCGGTDSVVAIYQRFATRDRPIVVALGNDRLWLKACAALDLHALAADAGLATNAGRRSRRAEVVAAFEDVLATTTAAAAIGSLQNAGVPCSTIRTLSEVVDDPQVIARQSIVEQQHPVAGPVRLVSSPWLLDSMPDARTTVVPAPGRGEHGRQILAEAGFAEAEAVRLHEQGEVRFP